MGNGRTTLRSGEADGDGSVSEPDRTTAMAPGTDRRPGWQPAGSRPVGGLPDLGDGRAA